MDPARLIHRSIGKQLRVLAPCSSPARRLVAAQHAVGCHCLTVRYQSSIRTALPDRRRRSSRNQVTTTATHHALVPGRRRARLNSVFGDSFVYCAVRGRYRLLLGALRVWELPQPGAGALPRVLPHPRPDATRSGWIYSTLGDRSASMSCPGCGHCRTGSSSTNSRACPTYRSATRRMVKHTKCARFRRSCVAYGEISRSRARERAPIQETGGASPELAERETGASSGYSREPGIPQCAAAGLRPAEFRCCWVR